MRQQNAVLVLSLCSINKKPHRAQRGAEALNTNKDWPMGTPFNFVRNLMQKGQAKHEPEAAGRERIEVTEPACLDINSAELQFYAAVFDTTVADILANQSLSVPQRLIVDVVRNDLSEREFRAKAVPRLPSVIPKLLRSLRDPDTSARDYVEIINKDPAMSAAVLRLANSVYFNPQGNRINSIDVAVIKLGIDGLRSVLSAAVMQPLIQRQSDPFAHFGQRLWEHSLCCAVACEILAKSRGLESYKAYLLGLTHETGKITVFSELSKQLRRNGGDAKTMSATLFVPLMREKAASLSAAIAMDWELPKEICTALQQQVELAPGRQVNAYAHLLFQANLACEAFAITRTRAESPCDLQSLGRELKLPANFFQQLEQLSVQV